MNCRHLLGIYCYNRCRVDLSVSSGQHSSVSGPAAPPPLSDLCSLMGPGGVTWAIAHGCSRDLAVAPKTSSVRLSSNTCIPLLQAGFPLRQRDGQPGPSSVSQPQGGMTPGMRESESTACCFLNGFEVGALHQPFLIRW